MSKFNSTHSPTKTQNLAGGSAYIQNPKFELASILLTTFLNDGAYRSGTDTMERIKQLVQADPLFAAKAAVYARREIGMRSVSHVVAGEVVEHVKGQEWTKKFIQQVIKRPDDMMEIMAYRDASYGLHPIPNALKKGIRSKLEELSEYSLAKYRGEGKKIKMIDLVNLTHPKGTEAINKLMKNELKAEDTWEYHLSHTKDKAGAWKYLLTNNKLGYFALLRNLRNIGTQAPDCIDLACAQLVNSDAIKKSLVLPFRFYTAYTMIEQSDVHPLNKNKILTSISNAMEISVDNMPELDGTTLVALDTSGSMTGARVSDRSGMTVAQLGALFSCAMLKKLGSNAALMQFDTQAEFLSLNPADSVMTNTTNLVRSMRGGGTNLDLPFTHDHKFDRVIILSDMQAWTNGQYGDRHMNRWYAQRGQHQTAQSALNAYRERTGCNPTVFALDLSGYGTMQFPETNCYQLAGWSEKVFDLIKLLEEDRMALINKIEEVKF